MSNLKLEIGFGDYDRTKVMVDGSVKIDGVDANYHSYRIVTEVFEAMVRERAFHVAELGMSYFSRTMDFDDPPFLGYQYFRTVVSGIRQSISMSTAVSENQKTSLAKPWVCPQCTVMTRVRGQRAFCRTTLASSRSNVAGNRRPRIRRKFEVGALTGFEPLLPPVQLNWRDRLETNRDVI
jgi:hypothetical protein